MTSILQLFLFVSIWAGLALARPLPAQTESERSEWQQLFNGQDLSGWQHVGGGNFVVEDGLLKTEGGIGMLYWKGGPLGDCILRVVFKTKGINDNSGVHIRIPLQPRERSIAVHYGYEVQIDSEPERWDENDYHYTGALYSFTKALARPALPGPEWNTMEITISGPRTRVLVNDVQVTDFTEGDPVPVGKDSEPKRGPRPNQGYIGVQNHGDQDTVYFKEIAVKSL